MDRANTIMRFLIGILFLGGIQSVKTSSDSFQVYAVEFHAIADPELDSHSIESAYDITSLLKKDRERFRSLAIVGHGRRQANGRSPS